MSHPSSGSWMTNGRLVRKEKWGQTCSQLCARMGGFSQEEHLAHAHEVGCRQHVQPQQELPLCSLWRHRQCHSDAW